jgi:hypothetical protein
MFVPLLIGAILRPNQLPKVSLELRGVRLENAASELAKAFGMDGLEIGPSIKNDVILVRTKDVEPETLKANLAKVLNATWIHKKEGWWFNQTDDQKQAERKIYEKERYKVFTEMVEKSKKKLQTLKPFDEANCKQILKDLQMISKSHVDRNNNTIWRRISKIDEQSPTSRFAYRASLRITPDIWMKLSDENPRMVFCNHPNSMQQPFPFPINDLISTAMDEQNQWSTFATGEPLRGPSAGNGDYEGWYGLGSLNDHREPFRTTDFSTVTMTVELNNQTIEFNAYDAKGKSVMNSSVNNYDYGDDFSESNYKDEFEKMKKKFVKVTGDAEEYLDIVSPMNIYGRQTERKKPISPSLLAKILHPEKIDPLSIAAPEIYLQSIDTPNVVMVMNDNQRSLRLPEFKDSRYTKYMPTNIVDANGWFLLSSPNPNANRKSMPDRKKLGLLLRFMHDNNRPLNLEEQADFAIQVPWGRENSWLYRSYTDMLKTNEVESYNNDSSLRVYGSMTSGQRERAKKGGLPFSLLSDDAKLEIFRAIFYTQKYETQVQMDWEKYSEMTPKQQQDLQEMQQLLYGGIYEEKSFVLPQGLTNSLSLTIEDNTSANLYCGRPPAGENDMYYGGNGRTMQASELGSHLFRMTNPQRYYWENQDYYRIDENNIRCASQRVLTIKMKIANSMYFAWNLNQTLITDPTVYTSKTLPKAILEEVKKGFDQAEKQDKEGGQFYGGPPRKVNPPPTT